MSSSGLPEIIPPKLPGTRRAKEVMGVMKLRANARVGKRLDAHFPVREYEPEDMFWQYRMTEEFLENDRNLRTIYWYAAWPA